uniref:Uncharacterized protein n=1 Tax=Rangifer tarandus platyrhynchus TaxID=3082113 RepID=A0ACB0F3Z2_RANTA|nr:unnamed protein product [Rangifer tarandus platyrhynchus]
MPLTPLTWEAAAFAETGGEYQNYPDKEATPRATSEGRAAARSASTTFPSSSGQFKGAGTRTREKARRRLGARAPQPGRPRRPRRPCSRGCPQAGALPRGRRLAAPAGRAQASRACRLTALPPLASPPAQQKNGQELIAASLAPTVTVSLCHPLRAGTHGALRLEAAVSPFARRSNSTPLVDLAPNPVSGIRFGTGVSPYRKTCSEARIASRLSEARPHGNTHASPALLLTRLVSLRNLRDGSAVISIARLVLGSQASQTQAYPSPGRSLSFRALRVLGPG